MELQEKTLGQCFREACRRNPERLAAVDSERKYTYEELKGSVDALAGSFLAHGFSHGSHIGVFCRNRADALIVYFAVWSIGAVLVPLNRLFTERELRECIQRADIELLISDRALDPGIPVWQMDDLPAGTVPKTVLREAQERVQPQDTDTILFTSGTLAVPKPVMSTHYARVNIAFMQAETLRLTENDRVLSVLPMFHCFGLTATVLPTILAGACLCCPADTHSYHILDMIEQYRCTVFTAVPALFLAVMRRQAAEPRDISSLRTGYVGGSTYSEDFLEHAERCLGMVVLPSLGQTEATAGVTTASLDDPFEVRANTIGHVFPHIEYSIREGELCLRGWSVMQGYYGMPEETAAVIDRDGWLYTGDLVHEQGKNLVYDGRKRELIIRGGENISPLELETVLLGDPRIRECKVTGIHDPHYSEIVCACIVPQDTLTEKDVIAVLKDKVAHYKLPQKILFLKELPKTSTGKVDLQALKDRIKEQ